MSSLKSIVVAGATGLIGSSLIRHLKADNDFSEIIILTRRIIPGLDDDSRFKQHIADLNDPSTYRDQVKGDYVVSALGTTIKTAGSKENFRKVDYDMPINLAHTAAENNCRNYILVSSIGADPASKVFYNRIKGEVERDLKKLGFKSLHLLQPSLLLGEREEKRTGEKFAQKYLPKISFLLPDSYKPVPADTIARKIIRIAKDSVPGLFIYRGSELYS